MPCLVIVSVHPWSTTASRWVPRDNVGLMICWVDRGVRNHKEVVMMCGRWGIRVLLLYLVNRVPARVPSRRARIGSLAATGEIGEREIGGRIIQFKVAPHMTAARERVAVGTVNRALALWGLRRGGC